MKKSELKSIIMEVLSEDTVKKSELKSEYGKLSKFIDDFFDKLEDSGVEPKKAYDHFYAMEREILKAINGIKG